MTESVSGRSAERRTDDIAGPAENRPASAAPDLLEVGRIGKPHGLRGEVVVTWSTNLIDQRTALGTRLLADEQWLTVATARPHQNRWLIGFEGFTERTEADLLRGRILRAEPIESEGDVFVHDLVGKTLVDQHGVAHGSVVAMVANPASDLIELGDGRLVPFVFYRSHDEDQVRVDVPAGLLDGETA